MQFMGHRCGVGAASGQFRAPSPLRCGGFRHSLTAYGFLASDPPVVYGRAMQVAELIALICSLDGLVRR